MEHRADTLIAQMRSAGLRITCARRAIAESIVTHADDHLTAEELTPAVQLDDHVMHQGRIVETGPAARVLAAPEAAKTIQLLASVAGSGIHRTTRTREHP